MNTFNKSMHQIIDTFSLIDRYVSAGREVLIRTSFGEVVINPSQHQNQFNQVDNQCINQPFPYVNQFSQVDEHNEQVGQFETIEQDEQVENQQNNNQELNYSLDDYASFASDDKEDPTVKFINEYVGDNDCNDDQEHHIDEVEMKILDSPSSPLSSFFI